MKRGVLVLLSFLLCNIVLFASPFSGTWSVHIYGVEQGMTITADEDTITFPDGTTTAYTYDEKTLKTGTLWLYYFEDVNHGLIVSFQAWGPREEIQPVLMILVRQDQKEGFTS